MKAASAALTALLNAAGGAIPLITFDFITITLQNNGGVLYFGCAPFPISAVNSTIWNPPAIGGGGGMWFAGINWQPSLMGVAGDFGSQGHWKVGLDTDTWQLVYAPRSFDPLAVATTFPDKINGVPWLQAAAGGALDNADIIVSTAYFATMPVGPIPLAGVSPVGTLIKFRGLIGAVDCSDTAAYITATDYKSILNQMMPRNLYQAPCRHRLFDARCTLSPAGFTQTGVSGSVASGSSIVANAPVAAPAGSGTFVGGLLTMTSGLNNGFRRFVSDWDKSATFALLNPFPFPVAIGDTFSVQAGCDKTLTTCNLFANQVNFGGENFIPIPEVAYG